MLENKEKSKILLVDDRPENLLALESLLDGLNCEMHRATSGKEALLVVLKHDFALILLDVQMPEMDGFEVAEIMRSSKKTQSIPIIFVTAISKEQKYVFKGYEVGAVDYMPKPIDPDILRSKVKVFLQLHEQKKLLEKQAHELEEEITLRKEYEDTLQQINQKLKTANQQKSEFLQFLSMELRAPLSTITGYITLALRNQGGTKNGKSHDILHHAQQATRNLQLLVSDVVDYSQFETKQMELTMEQFDIREIIEECVFIAKELIVEESNELITDIAADLPEIENDYVLVKKIINNILTNAVKLIKTGTILLNVGKIENDGIKLEVILPKTGIDEETLPFLSDPFNHDDSTEENRFSESNISLVITKKFCEMINTNFQIILDEGDTVIFRYELPLKIEPNLNNKLDPERVSFEQNLADKKEIADADDSKE